MEDERAEVIKFLKTGAYIFQPLMDNYYERDHGISMTWLCHSKDTTDKAIRMLKEDGAVRDILAEHWPMALQYIEKRMEAGD